MPDNDPRDYAPLSPLAILEEVQRRPMVLYHNDPEDLQRLLKQALGKFADKAGYICESIEHETEFFPPHPCFKTVASIADCKGRYVPWYMDMYDRNIKLSPLDKNEPPYRVYWFVDLRRWPLTERLPGDCPPLLADYLEALVMLQNTKRERSAMMMTGSPQASELPSEQELRQRIADLETEMEENKNMIVPASYF